MYLSWHVLNSTLQAKTLYHTEKQGFGYSQTFTLTPASYSHSTSISLHSTGLINSILLSQRGFPQSTTRPHQSTARPLERAASHIKGTRPPCFILVAAMGKRKQINNSNSPYVSDVISLYIHERNHEISLMPCFLP